MGIHQEKDRVKNNTQVSGYISEGNPNTQKLSTDQRSAQLVRQAIKDDQGLSEVARDIHVSVEEGTITFNEGGQQINK